ncbi:thioredoxin family protein [Arcticibacter sp. MXS-1]|uniref:thioredoxin family protein n=1 Tax=Arcticibacter sp. MXS-1 TaxID=3341726 RepID=UPI0035A861C8
MNFFDFQRIQPLRRIAITITLLICLGLTNTVKGQTPGAALYNPSADAAADLKSAVSKAAKEGKHVFVQIGGNWCVWCLRFNKLVTENDTLKTIIKDNYVVVHLNYSKENKNEKVLASLGYPQRFGFPVFVILDNKGLRLHTQNSAYLEDGKGHSAKKVEEFLKGWTPAALSPDSYK